MIVTSKAGELIPVEKQKLLRSIFWGILAVLLTGLASYMEQFGLPEQLTFLAPLAPVIINAINKWAREHTYYVSKN